MPAETVPAGYHTVTPFLVVKDAAGLIVFLERVFRGEVTERLDRPDGAIRHAEVRIGDSKIMLGGASELYPAIPGAFYVYVPDADAVYRRALEAGAQSIMEPADQLYGDRNAGVKDAWGNTWWIASRIEEVSPEEIARRMGAVYRKQPSPPEN